MHGQGTVQVDFSPCSLPLIHAVGHSDHRVATPLPCLRSGMLVPDSAKQALAADDPSGGQDVSGPPGAVTPDISSTLMYQTDSSAEEFIREQLDGGDRMGWSMLGEG